MKNVVDAEVISKEDAWSDWETYKKSCGRILCGEIISLINIDLYSKSGLVPILRIKVYLLLMVLFAHGK